MEEVEGRKVAEMPAGPVKGAGIGIDQSAVAFRPRNWEEIWNFASLVCKTDFVPQALRGNAGAVLAAVQMGHEIGLPPMASLRWIAVVRGVPTIWGDGFWGIITNHALCESFKELGAHEAMEKGYGECTIKRRGNPEPITRRYTIKMAEQAGLWGGKGSDQEKREKSVWFTNPGRMLQMRARALAGRDAIPEATGGLSIREEVIEEYPADLPSEESRPLATPRALPAAESSVAKNGDPAPAKAAEEEKPAGRRKAKSEKVETPVSPAKEPEADSQASQRSEPAPEKQAETPVEKTQDDIVNELLLWIENATKEDFFADPNWLLQQLHLVKGTENQLRVLRPFNDRRAMLRQMK